MKKASANWYIAGVHWIIALIASVILGLLVMIPSFLFPKSALIIMIILDPVVMWFAVMCSALYINPRYGIKDPGGIAAISTVYLVITLGIPRLFSFLDGRSPFIDLVGMIVVVGVFYASSKKFIKNNSVESSAPVVP